MNCLSVLDMKILVMDNGCKKVIFQYLYEIMLILKLSFKVQGASLWANTVKVNKPQW